MDINHAIKQIILHHRKAVQKVAWEFMGDVDTLYTLRSLSVKIEDESFHVLGDSDKYVIMVRKSSIDNDVLMFGKVDKHDLEKTVERDIKRIGLAILAIRHIDDDQYMDNLLSRKEELLDQLILCFDDERFDLADGTSYTLRELKNAIA
ncbi:hypothetical protein Desdi_0235 [Desulfitobacterium dichloroeliminans LMG P-21439]|uniref:Uncharacterized protein n=1 Tax=Desulfitobacterium dichloroeliminans (strain LMG P-21439 / DCA1) TaxID=871963 RepID=L0F1P6_DESDL|nr:hypothetical protein [Desulfitobacterium dichloroeliminans]AGA67784.1 hypothetical protein Desdi_0235 [Desulfitobacterium dichloroeliminans LMG P-21439]